MNEKKLKQLLASARQAVSPPPPPDFAADVLRAVRREPAARFSAPFSIFDHLNVLFPRVALAAAVVIVLCAAADFALTAASLPELGDGAAQVSSQFLFNLEDL